MNLQGDIMKMRTGFLMIASVLLALLAVGCIIPTTESYDELKAVMTNPSPVNLKKIGVTSGVADNKGAYMLEIMQSPTAFIVLAIDLEAESWKVTVDAVQVAVDKVNKAAK